MTDRAHIILKSGKDQSVMRYHPWVFSGAIKKIHGDPVEGDLVNVFNNKNEFLATGHFQKSSIAVRILSFTEGENFQNLWENRVLDAWNLRETLGLVNNPQTNVYRLINAEGDGLPGLIVDVYGETSVMQMHSAGMYRERDRIAKLLTGLPGAGIRSVYDKSSATLPFKSGIEPADAYLEGESADNTVLENGYRFKIDWEGGQKTGFFVDQRENRALLEKYSENRSVLNMFCYTGGFSVYALGGNAKLVHSVDASAKAMDLTEENITLNFPEETRHTSFAVDAFEFFERREEEYDLMILDPPAFAKHLNVLGNALQGYKKLNRKAIELIRPGGIIFTFSCSQVVSRENFRKSVFTAAANTGRKVRILHQMNQPADHPVSIYHPEGEYLKGLVLKID